MALIPGTRLGPYEILAPLGAGGMGEVYRARDKKLGRDVALKVLPEAFANDHDRMVRFEREAQVLASLNHSNIASIYGLEESNITRALVMELVDGPTLTDRIAQGPMSLEEVLPIAKQIAVALEYAHERGIVHRDLKPANVKVKPDGTVKVLDFGLAKALEDDPVVANISHSPTLSAAATKAGIILGTAAYMSPEQAKGRAVDRRADIWSFGVVLYEMLTGQPLYAGETASETLAQVITKEPDWTALPVGIPGRTVRLLRRCLTKDPKQRLQAIGEARIDIEGILSGTLEEWGSPAGGAARPQSEWRRALPWAIAAILALTTIAFAIGFLLRAPKPPSPLRLSVEIGADANLLTGFGASAILSPDGMRLAFLADGSDQKRRLYVRPLDQLQATALSGTENAQSPFFSPDGQWLGFFADGKLKKISVQGGAAVTVCDAASGRGGSWSEDGTIVFAPDIRATLSKVSSAGGTPQPLTTFDKQVGEVTHRWPQVLPGGKAVLFTSNTHGGNYEDADIVVYSMSGGQRKAVLHGGFYARYLNTGHLVYMHEGTLFAVPFDLQRLEVTGEPAPVLEGVAAVPGDGSAQFSISGNGNLAYIAGHGGFQAVSIYWMDREGKLTPLRETPGDYYCPAFSPDGKRLALQINDGKKYDIWVYDWTRDTLTRLTFDARSNIYPAWTPDGQRITYSSSEKAGEMDLYWKRADGTGDVQQLTKSKPGKLATSWRPDGKVFAFDQIDAGTSRNIMTMTMEGNDKQGWKPGEPKIFLKSPFTEESASFSPDGRWLAYESFESGKFEVYVRPFPGPGGKWQVSTGGGSFPKWSRNGKELFYLTQDSRIMVSTYTASGDSFRADKPQLWSGVPITNRLGFLNFDVHPDGKRIAVLKASGTGVVPKVDKVSFIFNFFDELRRKVPSGKN